MNVLIAAAEGAPFMKTGGLGEVIGSLPHSLNKLGVDIRIIMPLYKDIVINYKSYITHRGHIFIDMEWRRQYCGIYEAQWNGVKYYFVDNEYYFYRDGVYGYSDDCERYVFFCKAILELLPYMDFIPDIIHCNDWHTALVPVLMEKDYKKRRGYGAMKSLYSIHNLMYQGIMCQGTLKELLGMGYDKNIEYYGRENLTKGALVYSDMISTVSPTYAIEIRTPEYGEGLEGVLVKKGQLIKGIINGIDNNIYNPDKDCYIYEKYNNDCMDKKVENKLKLQRQLGLEENAAIPLIGMVTRIVSQKGFDLVEHIIDILVDEGVQLAFLGRGEENYEKMLVEASQRHRGSVSVMIEYSDLYAHRMYAGCDMLLMPSAFEPCGIGQMIALRYGTIPIVRQTGGLKDTVIPYHDADGIGNGFCFKEYDANDMLNEIRRAVLLYKNKELWKKLQKNAMDCDNSWQTSAQEYLMLYKEMLK